MKTKIRKAIRLIFKSLGILLILFFLASLIPMSEEIPKIKPRQSTQYWTLKDGFNIAYTKLEGKGVEKNIPVIFLHGGPGGYIQTSIINEMKHIAALGYDVFLYDQIGSGLSDRLPKPKDYSFDRHLIDLKEIITSHIRTEKVVLIGQSYGAELVAHFMAYNPELVEKVVFTSPGPLTPYEEDLNGMPIDLSKRYKLPSSIVFKKPISNVSTEEVMLPYMLKPRMIMSNLCSILFNIKWASDDEMDAVVNAMASKFTAGMVCDPVNVIPEEGGGGGYSHMFSNFYIDVPDIREKLKLLNIPSIVIQGQCDGAASYAQAYEYADLTNGNYMMIENAGHEIWWEQPQHFISTISKFLKD